VRRSDSPSPAWLRMVRASKTVLAALVGLAVSTLVVEIIMIVAEPYINWGIYQYDPDLGFRVRPGAWGSNHFGFNAREYSRERLPGIYRVLVVSDSFNWVGGLEGNYTALLERKLDQHFGGHSVDVINVGYPMTHTCEELDILRKYGLQYQPDLVVLGFFAGNDFLDGDPLRKRLVVNDVIVDIDRRHERRLFGYPIIAKFRLGALLKQRWRIWREGADANRNPAPGTFSEEAFLEVERERLQMFERRAPEMFRTNIDYILGCMGKMAELLHGRHIEFLVAIYPDELQVNESLYKGLMSRFRLKEEDYERDMVQTLVRNYLADKHVPAVDLLQRFRNEEERQSLYTPRDTHWNDAGNRLAAELLFPSILGFADSGDGR